MVYESIGQLVLNVGLMGGGALLGLISLLFAMARGMTKNNEHWSLIFASLSWAFALAIPSAEFSIIIFIFGAFSITVAYLPVLKNINESNVFTIAIIALLINFTLLAGFDVYGLSSTFDWNNNIQESKENIENIFNINLVTTNGLKPESGLCKPGEQSCENSAQQGTFESTVYDVFATYLAIPTYIGKAIVFAGAGLFAPIIITTKILSSNAVKVNGIVATLIAIYILMWELIILYKTIIFILKRTSNL